VADRLISSVDTSCEKRDATWPKISEKTIPLEDEGAFRQVTDPEGTSVG
jgi:hypothetical protein